MVVITPNWRRPYNHYKRGEISEAGHVIALPLKLKAQSMPGICNAVDFYWCYLFCVFVCTSIDNPEMTALGIKQFSVFIYLQCHIDFYYERATQQCETENRNLSTDRYSSYNNDNSIEIIEHKTWYDWVVINKNRDKRIRAQSTKKMCARTHKLRNEKKLRDFRSVLQADLAHCQRKWWIRSTFRWSVNVCCFRWFWLCVCECACALHHWIDDDFNVSPSSHSGYAFAVFASSYNIFIHFICLLMIFAQNLMVNIMNTVSAAEPTSAFLLFLLHFHHHQHFSSFHFYYNNKLWTKCVCKAWNYVFVGQMLRAIFCVVRYFWLKATNFPPLGFQNDEKRAVIQIYDQ